MAVVPAVSMGAAVVALVVSVAVETVGTVVVVAAVIPHAREAVRWIRTVAANLQKQLERPGCRASYLRS